MHGVISPFITLTALGSDLGTAWIKSTRYASEDIGSRGFENLLRGVIDSRNIIYFLSLIGFSLALAFRSLESRRWS